MDEFFIQKRLINTQLKHISYINWSVYITICISGFLLYGIVLFLLGNSRPLCFVVNLILFLIIDIASIKCHVNNSYNLIINYGQVSFVMLREKPYIE